jgi:hypothetical protein
MINVHNVADNPDYRRHRKRYKNKMEIVNTGSGPSYFNIDFSHKTENYLSLAMWPQNFEYDLRMLKSYDDLLKDGCIVVVVVTCPLSFGKYYRSEQELHDRSLRYARYLNRDQEPELSNREYIIQHYFYANDSLRKIYHALKRLLGMERKIVFEDEMTMQELIDCWYSYIHLTNLRDAGQADAQRDGIEKNIRDLSDLIDYCLNRNYKPVLAITPVCKDLRSYMSEEFLEEFLYKNIQTANQDRIRFLDYSKDTRFAESSLYRKNRLFLNEKGRSMFSDILWETLTSNGKEETICWKK